tara:strand:- start:301 stop:1224 length:924 start_codon:yes stop_codon:yes gene_type:complete
MYTYKSQIKISTFKEIEFLYNSIKPMIGKRNVGHDIRPIDKRSRKWERIIKISANKYALSDCHVYHILSEYPIIWERHRDGRETITISNGIGGYSHQSRYSFLSRHLPHGLQFVGVGNGLQYIRLWQGEGAHLSCYLPKHKSSKEMYPLVFGRAIGSPRWESPDTQYEYISPKRRIRQDVKAPYKKDIEEFLSWFVAITPLLTLGGRIGGRNWSYVQECVGVIHDLQFIGIGINNDFENVFRKIISDEGHPNRLELAVYLGQSNTNYEGRTLDFKKAIARKIDTLCEFVYITDAITARKIDNLVVEV